MQHISVTSILKRRERSCRASASHSGCWKSDLKIDKKARLNFFYTSQERHNTGTRKKSKHLSLVKLCMTIHYNENINVRIHTYTHTSIWQYSNWRCIILPISTDKENRKHSIQGKKEKRTASGRESAHRQCSWKRTWSRKGNWTIILSRSQH